MSALLVLSATLAHAIGSTITGGVFIITSLPDQSMMIEGKPAFAGPLKYTFAGGSAPGFVPGTVATVVEQVIVPSTTDVALNGLPTAMDTDTGIMVAVGTLIGGGTGPVGGPVEVADAGQESVTT